MLSRLLILTLEVGLIICDSFGPFRTGVATCSKNSRLLEINTKFTLSILLLLSDFTYTRDRRKVFTWDFSVCPRKALVLIPSTVKERYNFTECVAISRRNNWKYYSGRSPSNLRISRGSLELVGGGDYDRDSIRASRKAPRDYGIWMQG